MSPDQSAPVARAEGTLPELPLAPMAGQDVGVSFGKKFQRVIITIHRWIGIGVCIMVMTWFISGLVLAYVPFPKMSPEEKLRYLRPIDWTPIRVSPSAAMAAAGLAEYPKELRLEMSGNEPVYRITNWDRHNFTVAADTGEVVKRVSGDQALAIVKQQLSAPSATIKAANVDSDQWTMTGYWNRERPFHIIVLNDPQGSLYYVSAATGEILMGTRQAQRLLNWFGAIPHWLYFESLRRYTHEAAWTWTIYIVAGAGIFVSLSGLWIGISRMRLRKRYTNGTWTPFSGWMKWHHVTGVIGGVTLALWVISGFFTMYPGGFLEQRDISKTEYQRYAGNRAPRMDFSALGSLAVSGDQASRATFRYVEGRPIAVLERSGTAPRVIDSVTGMPSPITVDQIAAAARHMLPDAKIVSTAYLGRGDEYWHSAYHLKKTPIVRVVFDDPQATWFHIDPETGEVLGILDKIGRVDRWTVVAIHDVDLNWLLTRRPLWDIVLFAVSIPGILIAISTFVIGYRRLQRNHLMPAFAGVGFHGQSERPARVAKNIQQFEQSPDAVLVAYATQTGTAELLANRTADCFRLAGIPTHVRDLGELDARDVARAKRAIFVISTTGEGDPPDRSIPFQRRVMRSSVTLGSLQYGLLALGDRQYSSFCGFGAAVDSWLSERGAQRMFPSINVNERDPQALRRWSQQLRGLTGQSADFTLTEEPFRPWRLIERRLANPGSAGGQAFYLRLEPEGEPEAWEAGDIAQIVAGQSWRDFQTRNHALMQREFSIATTPQEQCLELLVRYMRTPGGQPGIASGYLLESHKIGDAVPLRVRRNPSFHGPSDDRPMLLIGSGTGIAGLRAHLLRRTHLGHYRNWLVFGERSAAHDNFYESDLRQWQAAGHLERLDLVFSRDQSTRLYVQHLLLQHQSEVRAWVEAGAAIYVCGSNRGMAPSVNEGLATILGEDQLQFIAHARRYLRDIY
jgi:sulfite reductase alpha subunit-like flavoprotein/uncharacterized iron-regulated membrane protein